VFSRFQETASSTAKYQNDHSEAAPCWRLVSLSTWTEQKAALAAGKIAQKPRLWAKSRHCSMKCASSSSVTYAAAMLRLTANSSTHIDMATVQSAACRADMRIDCDSKLHTDAKQQVHATHFM
jgi:hypothetical protein